MSGGPPVTWTNPIMVIWRSSHLQEILFEFFEVTSFKTVVLYVTLITGGPPLAQKSLARFPLQLFLAYVYVSGGISVSRGPHYSPTNTNFMEHVFFHVPKCV